jgi:hypothetical protein
VVRLVGMPREVLERAGKVLRELEGWNPAGAETALPFDKKRTGRAPRRATAPSKDWVA